MEKTNRKNRWMLLLLTAVMLPLQALAENSTNSTLAIEQFSINAGETKQMLIDLNNPSQEVTMVEFYMYLPTGLSVAEEDGDLAVDIAGRTTWKKHSLEASQTSSGAIHVMLYSGSNTIISGTSGALLSFTLTAASTFNGGDIQLKQQLMTSPDEAKTESKPADYTYTISGSDIPFNDGDTFTASNSEGVEMTFKVISAADKTCEVVRQGKDRITIVSTPVPESIIIPAEVNGFEVVSIGYQAFYGSKKIKSVVIPEGVTSIDTHAFRDCENLASITFPKSLKECGYASFEECAYNATVHISDLKSWCNVALTNWDLYGWHLFLNGDEVQDLVIPDGVTSIGESQENVSPFTNCASLTTVTIPSSVTTMYAPFSGCSNLTSVTVLAEMPVAINTEIPNATAAIANATLYVPKGCKAAYEAADYWKDFKEIIEDLKDGDTFTAETEGGNVMTFEVLSAANKTCEVIRKGYESNTFVTLASKDVVIPSKVNGFKVVSIGYEALIAKLTSLTIPESLTSIKAGAFENYDRKAKIGEIRITDLTAFCNIKLSDPFPSGFRLYLNGEEVTMLTIPEGISYVGEDTWDYSSPFSGCISLTSAEIPNGVTSLGYGAFWNCTNLTSVSIPATLTSIGYGAFDGCTNVTSFTSYVEQPSDIQDLFCDFGEFCANATLYVPKGSKTAYEAADGWKDFKEIVEMEDENPDDIIIFADAKVKAICVANWDTNNDGELSMDEAAAVTSIGEIFYHNTEITSFDELQYFTGLTEIGADAFNGSSLTSVSVPNNVNTIGARAFRSNTSLASVTIPASVTSIAAGALYGCPITSIYISDLTRWCTISTGAITDEALLEDDTNVHLYLNGEEVTNLVIPDGVTTIRPFCFLHFNCITSVTIPSSVTSIGNGAFWSCSAVTSVTTMIANPFDVEDDDFFYSYEDYVYNNATLYVPTGSKTTYENTDGWKNFNNIVEMENDNPDGIITFADANVKAICVANWDTNNDGELSKGEAAAVTSLGNAFKSSSEITSFNELQYFTGLTEIGENAFNGSSLVSVSLPNSLNTIGVQAFYNCNKLEDVTLPEGLNSIGYSAFEGCSSLKEVTLPSTLTEIGASAFYDCHGLIAVFSNIMEPFSIARTVFEQTIEWDDYTNDHFMPSSATLYVPYGKKEIYKSVAGLGFNTNGWTRFANMEEMDEDFPNGIINFADANVKTICVAKWDKNGDGELSKGEAAAVTSLDDAFKNNEEITSFDELEHFLLVTKLDIGAFRNCTHLTSLKLPKGLKEICANAFTNCQSLESLHIPASLRTISEESVFHYCLSLTGFTVDESNYTFSAEDGILYKWSKTVLVCCPATKTGTLTLPSTVETIMTSAFAMCTKLTTLKLPASLTKIGDAAFVGCSGLTYFDFAADGQLSEIGIGCFNGCSKLYAFRVGTGWNGKLAQNYEVYDRVLYDIKSGSRKLVAYPNKRNNFYTLPEGVTDILDYAFCMTEIKNVTLPASLKTIHPYAFAYCEQLTKVTSLAWQPCDVTNVFTGTTVSNATLSVRKGTKTAYENTDGWDGFKTTEEFISYDVNEDGYTNMKDVETIADYIMGKAPDGFIWQKVDTNGDDYVNAADIVKLVKNIPVIDPEAGIDDPCPDCGVDDDF